MALLQLRLDVETADVIAASKVRAALEKYVNPSRTVSDLVLALHAAAKVDERTCAYILLHESRFAVCPPPILFEARWVLETAQRRNLTREPEDTP